MKKLLAYIRRSVIVHFIAYLLVLGTMSIMGFAWLIRPTIQEIRVDLVRILGDLAQAEGGKDTRAGALRLSRLNRYGEFLGVTIWEADGKGNVLSATEGKIPTLDWESLALPGTGGETAWVDRVNGRDLYATRLVDNQTRYILFLFAKRSYGQSAVMAFVMIPYVWMIVLSVVGMFYVIDKTKKQVKTSLLSNQGFSMLAAVVTLAILGMLAIFTTRLMTLNFRGSAHTDLRYSVHALANTVEQKVDCAETFKSINLTTTCGAQDPATPDVFTTLPKPIVLRDKSGVALTSYTTAGTTPFNPADQTLDESGRLGEWYLRAYCTLPNGNLVIRFSKPASTTVPISFVTDPLLKRPYDWAYSTHNPLFGTPDRVLCTGGQTASGIPLTRAAVFDVAGTYQWTVPSGVGTIITEIWGGGAGGGGARYDTTFHYACGGGGGGGGGYAKSVLSVAPGSVFTLKVGSGGQGSPAGTGVSKTPGNPVVPPAFLRNGKESSVSLGSAEKIKVEGGQSGTSCVWAEPSYHTGMGGVGGCQSAASCPCPTCTSHVVTAGAKGTAAVFNYASETWANGGEGGAAPAGGGGGPHNYQSDSMPGTGTSPGGGGGGGSKMEHDGPDDAFGGASGAPGRIVIWF